MRNFNPVPFVVVAAAVAFVAGPAAAHARLVSATPAPNATIAPTRSISLTFSERSVPAFSGFDVVNSAGEKIAVETSVGDDGKTLTGTLARPLAAAKDCPATHVTDNVMLMDTPDEMLANAAAHGDRAAFSALVGRHYDRIHGLAWRLTGSRTEAEDLAQDICAALPAKLRNWRGEARFTNWLFRVVVNAAHDLRRRQATRSRAAQGWGDWELARQDEIAVEAAARDWLA